MVCRTCIFLAAVFALSFPLRGEQVMGSNWWLDLSVKERMNWLTEQAKRLIDGCRVKANDGTILYCPDGKGHYGALWTRDFAYMVENCSDMIPSEHIEACIRYLLSGQREDGCIPKASQSLLTLNRPCHNCVECSELKVCTLQFQTLRCL